jgi:hypothetical protein
MVLKVLKKIIKQNYLLFHEGIDYFKNNKNWKCKTPFEVNSEIVRDMYSSYSPVFVLSTGRCGTKFLSELLNNFNNIKAYHEAKPHMELFCNDIFYYNKKNYNDLIFIFNSIRYILILDSYIKNKIYFESNHALTFFAYAIKNCFNNAKFIHIIRDPRTFVRSAFIRDWYTDSSIWDVGRLMMENKKIWNKLDRIEKISWLWYTTNQYIENFKESNKGHVLIHTIKFEELFNDSNKLLNLVKFIGVNNVSTDFIKKFMKKKINSSKKENIKKSNYKVWNNVSN